MLLSKGDLLRIDNLREFAVTHQAPMLIETCIVQEYPRFKSLDRRS
jgi:hypothetical protein